MSADLAPAPPADADRSLIFATKVLGASIYDADGERVGRVHDIALDKTGGRIAYAIAAVDDFFGMGGKMNPIPWAELTYDPDKQGYRVRLSREELRATPFFALDDLADLGLTHAWVMI